MLMGYKFDEKTKTISFDSPKYHGNNEITDFPLEDDSFDNKISSAFEELKQKYSANQLFNDDEKTYLNENTREKLETELDMQTARYFIKANSPGSHQNIKGVVEIIDKCRGIVSILSNHANLEEYKTLKNLLDVKLYYHLAELAVKEEKYEWADRLVTEAVVLYNKIKRLSTTDKELFRNNINPEKYYENMFINLVNIGDNIDKKLLDDSDKNTIIPDPTPGKYSLNMIKGKINIMKMNMGIHVFYEEYEKAATTRDVINYLKNISENKLWNITKDFQLSRAMSAGVDPFVLDVGEKIVTDIVPHDSIYYLHQNDLSVVSRDSTGIKSLIDIGYVDGEKKITVYDKEYIPKILAMIHTGNFPMMYGRFINITEKN
ncbi:hypothetical protein HQ529_01390 [Candidatus Woesearchaeota archaeon]|nr:hypothetical protein [Candidatus Woesearchaeota archaeon]